jgi:hypothetical protein
MNKPSYTTLALLSILLLATSCDLELPPQYAAQVTIEGKWDKESKRFLLKGAYTLSEGMAQETGFYAINHSKIVTSIDQFEGSFDGNNFEYNQSYAFYAYVETKSGYYRSNTIVLTTDVDLPQISSATYDPATQELVINGTGFSENKDWNEVRVTIDGGFYRHDILSSSTTSLRIKYQPNSIGTASLYVLVRNTLRSPTFKVEIPGIKIEEITPMPFYYGQEVTIRTSGISLKDNFKSFNEYYSYGVILIESISDTEMKVRIYSDGEAYFSMIDKWGIYSNYSRLSIHSPLKAVEVISDISSFNRHEITLASSGTKCFIYEYVTPMAYSSNHLYSYDVISGEKKEIDIGVDTQEDCTSFPLMFVNKDYLYIIRQRYKRRYETPEGSDPIFIGMDYIKQEMFRISLTTGQQEWLNDPVSLPKYWSPPSSSIVADEQNNIVYIKANEETSLYTYQPENNIWGKASFSLPPSAHLVGCHNSYLYYTVGRVLYRIKEGTTGEFVFNMNPFDSPTIFGNFRALSIEDDTLYYTAGIGVFSISLSESMPKIPKAWGAYDLSGFPTIVVPYGEELFVVSGTVYQFVP